MAGWRTHEEHGPPGKVNAFGWVHPKTGLVYRSGATSHARQAIELGFNGQYGTEINDAALAAGYTRWHVVPKEIGVQFNKDHPDSAKRAKETLAYHAQNQRGRMLLADTGTDYYHGTSLKDAHDFIDRVSTKLKGRKETDYARMKRELGEAREPLARIGFIKPDGSTVDRPFRGVAGDSHEAMAKKLGFGSQGALGEALRAHHVRYITGPHGYEIELHHASQTALENTARWIESNHHKYGGRGTVELFGHPDNKYIEVHNPHSGVEELRREFAGRRTTDIARARAFKFGESSERIVKHVYDGGVKESRADQLILAALHEALQLRPSIHHLPSSGCLSYDIYKDGVKRRVGRIEGQYHNWTDTSKVRINGFRIDKKYRGSATGARDVVRELRRLHPDAKEFFGYRDQFGGERRWQLGESVDGGSARCEDGHWHSDGGLEKIGAIVSAHRDSVQREIKALGGEHDCVTTAKVWARKLRSLGVKHVAVVHGRYLGGYSPVWGDTHGDHSWVEHGKHVFDPSAGFSFSDYPNMLHGKYAGDVRDTDPLLWESRADQLIRAALNEVALDPDWERKGYAWRRSRKVDRDLHHTIRKAFASRTAYKILDSDPEVRNCTWTAGGCRVAAQALHRVLGGELRAVLNHDGRQSHAVLKHPNGRYYDADGEHTEGEMLDKMRHLERVTNPSIGHFDPDEKYGDGEDDHSYGGRSETVDALAAHLKKVLGKKPIKEAESLIRAALDEATLIPHDDNRPGRARYDIEHEGKQIGTWVKLRDALR